MVLTVNNFVGFETQGPEELNFTEGTITFPTTGSASGSAVMLLDADTDKVHVPWTASTVTDAGGSYIIGFRIKFLSGLQDINTFLQILETSSEASLLMHLEVGIARRILLTGHTGGALSTASETIKVNHWMYIEIWFTHTGTNDSVEMFVDGVSVLSSSTQDFLNSPGITEDSRIFFNHDGSNNIEVDDVYILSGASSASDRLGPIEVYMKQGAQTGTTPDTSALADTTLDEGTWEGASETPLDEETADAAASYTGTVVAAGVVYADGSGDKLGPNGDDRFTGGTIKAMKGLWRMNRSGGGATAQFGEIGNDGGVASDIETSADLDITASYANYEFLTETAVTFPTLAEHAAIGFSKDAGGQDLDVAEMWAMFLVVPNAPNVTDLADAEWPDQNYYAGPFEI